MQSKFRMWVRELFLQGVRLLGTRMVDQRTGLPLGRVFFFGWRGRIVAIGLSNEPPVYPVFLPQQRLTYWKQELGFTIHPPPDFPRSGQGS